MKARPILIGTQHAAGATATTSAEGRCLREPPNGMQWLICNEYNLSQLTRNQKKKNGRRYFNRQREKKKF